MISIFGRREYKIRLHEVALPLTIEEKKILGDVGPSDREGLRGRKWCTCSDVASWGSRAKAVSNEDIPEGCRDVDRWAAGGRIRPQATTKGSEDLPRRRSARDNGAAGNGSPPSLSRRPKRCPSSPSPAEGDTSGSVTSGEDRKTVFFEGRKTVWPPLSCLDLERMREWREQP